MMSHWGRVGGVRGCTPAMCSGITMIAINSRHSRSQQTSIPRYGNMPMGASPASAFGERASAGRKADLNSSQGDDHSTSRCGGSGHWVIVSGMVSTSGIVWNYVVSGGLVLVCQKGGLFIAWISVFLCLFSRGNLWTGLSEFLNFLSEDVYQMVPPPPLSFEIIRFRGKIPTRSLRNKD